MKKIHFCLYALCFLILFSCKEDEISVPLPGPQPSYKDIDIVTGLDFFDDNGNPVGRWRGPNDKRGEALIFPNPNIGTIFLFSQQEVTNVWLIPAECFRDTITFDIHTHAQALNYTISEVESASIIDIPISASGTNTNISLDFSDVSTGFYKLFYQMEDQIFWQNLFIDPTVNNIPTFDFLDDLCE